MNNLYIKTNIKLDVISEIHDFINTVTTWDHPDPMVSFYRGTVPNDLIKKSTVLSKLSKMCGTNPILILKMPAWSIATPHRDTYRSTSINFLLTENNDSDSFFLDKELRIAQYSIVPIEYDPYYCCVLNVKEQHCIVNRSHDRYVLSLTPNIQFEQVKQYLQPFI